MTSQPDAPRSTTPSAAPYPRASSWVGWIAFAAVCLSILGAYPALSLVMIALGVVVILALTVHGSDIKP